MAEKLPWFPFYASDWLTDMRVASMTVEQRGAYIQLLAMQWVNGSLPSDIKALALISGSVQTPDKGPVPPESLQRFKERIWTWPLNECFELDADNRLGNPKLGAIRKRRVEAHARMSTGGRRGGKTGRLKRDYTQGDWEKLIEETGGRCVRCGQVCIGRPVKDHIVPLLLGGRDVLANLQPLCRNCNSTKGTDSTNYLARWREHRRQDQGTLKAPSSKLESEPEFKEMSAKESKDSLTDYSAQETEHAIFQHWLAESGHTQSQFTQKRRSKIRQRLRRFTPEQLKQAITNACATPFYRGQNESGTRYDWLETILKNDEAVERHLERKQPSAELPTLTRRRR